MRNRTMKAFQVIDCQDDFALFTFSTCTEAMKVMRRCKGDVTVEAIKVDSETWWQLVATENKLKKVSK